MRFSTRILGARFRDRFAATGGVDPLWVNRSESPPASRSEYFRASPLGVMTLTGRREVGLDRVPGVAGEGNPVARVAGVRRHARGFTVVLEDRPASELWGTPAEPDSWRLERACLPPSGAFDA